MTSSNRVSEYRQRMRQRGYRPVQLWVPDVRSESFAREARRQSADVALADRTADDQDFIDAVADVGDEE